MTVDCFRIIKKGNVRIQDKVRKSEWQVLNERLCRCENTMNNFECMDTRSTWTTKEREESLWAWKYKKEKNRLKKIYIYKKFEENLPVWKFEKRKKYIYNFFLKLGKSCRFIAASFRFSTVARTNKHTHKHTQDTHLGTPVLVRCVFVHLCVAPANLPASHVMY